MKNGNDPREVGEGSQIKEELTIKAEGSEVSLVFLGTCRSLGTIRKYIKRTIYTYILYICVHIYYIYSFIKS